MRGKDNINLSGESQIGIEEGLDGSDVFPVIIKKISLISDDERKSDLGSATAAGLVDCEEIRVSR